MPLWESLFSQGTVERLGWMLVHFLWQATAVALLLAVLLRLMRRADANLRYAVACGALALMVALPLVTMQLVEVSGPAAEAGPPPAFPLPTTVGPTPLAVQRIDDLPPLSSAPPLEIVDLSTPIPWQERVVMALESALPYAVLGWLAGVLGLSAWHLGGWAQLQRLKRRMTRKAGPVLHSILNELADRLGVNRAVTLLESALVEVPTVVGWLRPVILLPASALTGLSPDQLRAILAHELAHVRRYDYLANILQTVIEILGFYHPGVWWVSHRIRIERENCCDDLAVRICGNSLQYARALTSMEEIRHSRSDLAMAASGGSLMARVARLLGRPPVNDRRFAWLPGLIALLLVVCIVIPAAFALSLPAEQSPQSPVDDAPPQAEQIRDATGPDSSPPADPTQILIEFRLFPRAAASTVVDRETRNLLGGILAAEQPQVLREIVHADPKQEVTLSEVLRTWVAEKPMTPETLGRFIDVLQSRGYLEGEARLEVMADNGEQAGIRLGSGELILPPREPAAPAEKVKLGTFVRVTPHISARTSDRVKLEIAAQWKERAEPDDASSTPVVRAAELTSTLVIPNGLCAALIASDSGVPEPQLRMLLVGPATIIEPQSAAGQPHTPTTTVVEPAAPDDAQPQKDAGIRTDWVIAKALTEAPLDPETLILIADTLAPERPQILHDIARADPGQKTTLGDVLRRYVTHQPLSQETGRILIELLEQRGLLAIQARPTVVAKDNQKFEIRSVSGEWFAPSAGNGDTAAEPALTKVDYGTVIRGTARIVDRGSIEVEMAVAFTEPAGPTPAGGLPIVRTMELATTVTTPSHQYFSLLVEPGDDRDTQTEATESLLVMFMPGNVEPIPLPPDESAIRSQQDRQQPQQVLLEARVVVMERDDLLNLGVVEWSFPTIQADQPLDVSGWLKSVQIGYSPGQAGTESLLAKLILLEQMSRADVVAQPAIVAQDGRQAQLRSVQEQWFLISNPEQTRPELRKIDSGTILTMTPRVGDHNEITLEMTIEISQSVPRGTASDLPIVTRRLAKNFVTIEDGGTVAVAGLAESFLVRNRPSKEVAIFVTARLMPETLPPQRGQTSVNSPAVGKAQPAPPSRANAQQAGITASFTDTDPMVRELSESIARIERDLIVLRQTRTETHPDVARREALLKAFRDRLQQRQNQLEEEFEASLAAARVAGTGPLRTNEWAPGPQEAEEPSDDRPPAPAPSEDQGRSSTPEEPPSRAWTIMRQGNCPPLLLGLAPQFAKVLEPSRRNDSMWKDTRDGGTLRVRVQLEGEDLGEVVIGLFADARWSQEPVAVRRVTGSGVHVLTGLPAGAYQIGAMIGEAPVPLALGVHHTWPEPVEIHRARTATAEVLVSEAFQQRASGWFNRQVAGDYLGQWGDLDEGNLLQGRLTGPDGRPIPFGEMMIQEHFSEPRSHASYNRATDEQGNYRFDQMAWPYRVHATWRDPLPSLFGYRSQRMLFNRVLEGKQRLDFRFDPFPSGTASVRGRVTDQHGQALHGFFIRINAWSKEDEQVFRNPDGKYHTYITYEVPFVSEDGDFKLGGLPEGTAQIGVIPFETQRYERQGARDVTLAAGQIANLDFQLTGKQAFHGRVLFEDGAPAVVCPAPWRGAVTRILLTTGGMGRVSGELDSDGYFTLYVDAMGGSSRLLINVPTDQERRWETVGEFPFEKLGQDKSQAGVVTVKRPLPTPTLPPALRQGGPLPSGWRLEHQERSSPGGQRMTQVSLRVRPASSDTRDGRPSSEEQFELYGPDGKRAIAFKLGSAFLLDKATEYTLVGRQRETGPVTRGPFTLDLSRPGQYTLTVDLGADPTLEPRTEAPSPGSSRAWAIMQQWNSPRLLQGLGPRLAKLLEPERQEDPAWLLVTDDGRLIVTIDMDEPTHVEVTIGLFEDAKWSKDPVAVRRVAGKGTHLLTGLPVGRFQVGAVAGKYAHALGVQRQWPQPVEIERGRTTSVELLVSKASTAAAGLRQQGIIWDYLGHWDWQDDGTLLRGRITGPDGQSIPFASVAVREHNPGATSIAAPNLGADADGVYKFGGMKWPYTVSMCWDDPLPGAFGSRYQVRRLDRVFEGPQELNVQFGRFPQGTARMTGRVLDERGTPVAAFLLNIRTPPIRDGRAATEYGYDLPFLSADGRFEAGGLPEGPVTARVTALGSSAYEVDRGKEVVLESGRTSDIPFELPHIRLFYGRVLFEDGSPAVITPAPWQGARTSVRMSWTTAPDGYQRTEEVDDMGYFSMYLRKQELDRLRSGQGRLNIRVPLTKRGSCQTVGPFPIQHLSEGKDRAGSMTVPQAHLAHPQT